MVALLHNEPYPWPETIHQTDCGYQYICRYQYHLWVSISFVVSMQLIDVKLFRLEHPSKDGTTTTTSNSIKCADICGCNTINDRTDTHCNYTGGIQVSMLTLYIAVMSTSVFKVLKHKLLDFSIEYAAPVWDPSTVQDIQHLESVQKFALRVSSKQWDLGYSELLDTCNLPTLENRRLYMKLCHQDCAWTMLFSTRHCSPQD